MKEKGDVTKTQVKVTVTRAKATHEMTGGYVVVDTRTGGHMSGRLPLRLALRKADRLDQAHGAVRFVAMWADGINPQAPVDAWLWAVAK